MEIHARLFDLAPVIEEVAVLMGPRVEEKDQRLVLDLPPGLPKVLADPVRVRQVLANLISNAHQYTDEGGDHHGDRRRRGPGHRAVGGRRRPGHGAGGPGPRVRPLRAPRRRAAAAPGSGCRSCARWSTCRAAPSTSSSQVGEGTVFTVRLPAEGQGSQTSHRVVEGSLVLVLTPRADLARHAGRACRGRRRQGQGAGHGAPGPGRPALASATTCCCSISRASARTAWSCWPALRDDPQLGRRPLVTVCSERPGPGAGRRVARPCRRGRRGAGRHAGRGHRGRALQHPGRGPLRGARPGRGRAAGHGPGPPVGHHAGPPPPRPAAASASRSRWWTPACAPSTRCWTRWTCGASATTAR